MLEATFVNGIIFKNIVAMVNNLIEKVELVFTQDRMRIFTMDQNNTSLIKAYFDKSWFYHYRCDKTIRVGIDCGKLLKVTRSCKAEYTTSISHTGENSVLLIEYVTEDDSYAVQTELFTLDINAEEYNVNDNEAEIATVSMGSKDFLHAIKPFVDLGVDKVRMCCIGDTSQVISGKNTTKTQRANAFIIEGLGQEANVIHLFHLRRNRHLSRTHRTCKASIQFEVPAIVCKD